MVGMMARTVPVANDWTPTRRMTVSTYIPSKMSYVLLLKTLSKALIKNIVRAYLTWPDVTSYRENIAQRVCVSIVNFDCVALC